MDSGFDGTVEVDDLDSRTEVRLRKSYLIQAVFAFSCQEYEFSSQKTTQRL